MKNILTFFFVSVSLGAFCCDKDCIESLLAKAAAFQNEFKEEEAIEILEEVLESEPKNYEALWRTSYSYIRVGWLVEEDNDEAEERRKLAFITAREFAIKAYTLSPDQYESILVLGGANAKLAKYLSLKEQIQIAWDIKDFADRMLAIDDQSADVYYFLAWWHFKVGSASSFERFMAKIFFGGLPQGADVQKGFEAIRKAIDLNPGYAVYHYDLGIFYSKTDAPEEARSCFNNALTCPSSTPEDSIYKRYATMRLENLP